MKTEWLRSGRSSNKVAVARREPDLEVLKEVTTLIEAPGGEGVNQRERSAVSAPPPWSGLSLGSRSGFEEEEKNLISWLVGLLF